MEPVTTFTDYQRLAARTARMDVSEEIRRATFALGLAGEACEVLELYLDDTGRAMAALPKELGDTLWYAAALCTAFDMPMGKVAGADDIATWQKTCYPKPFQDSRLAVEGGKIADYLKKVIGHGHDLDKKRLAAQLKSFLIRLGDIATEHRLSVVDIASANILKLKRRYPDGFSSERSRNRNDSDIPAC